MLYIIILFSLVRTGALILQSPDRNYKNFEEHLQNRVQFPNNTRNPWFNDYWTETFKCNIASSGSNTCTGMFLLALLYH